MSRWIWLLRQISRRIWVRATLFSLAAVLTALLAVVIAPFIPANLPGKIGSDAVDNILGIIASSMLAVTTFSLSTMVAAYSAATTNVTPRATRLIMEDTTTQNVLSTFLGSFLFSLVGIIALSTGLYGDRGRVVLFAVTLLVITAIVVTLLRWIDHLSRLGRVTETTQKVEAAAAKALRNNRDRPYLGGAALRTPALIPDHAQAVYADAIGYVQHVDVGSLSSIAENGSGRIFLQQLPGAFVDPATPLVRCEGLDVDKDAREIQDCFTIGDVRSFDQDPRFGAIVLTEIASRALSPSINDPGTAIDVIGRAVRLLHLWAEQGQTPEQVEYPRIFVPPIETGDLFDDFFGPIARDGAAIVEVGVRLQKALRMLANCGAEGYRESALRHAREAMERSDRAGIVETDRTRLQSLAVQTIAGASSGGSPSHLPGQLWSSPRRD